MIAFLDVFGSWDPSLALVMAGALLVYLPFVQGLRRSDPTRWTPSRPPPIDTPLVLGAALFGVGWGLSGLCPGPALVSLAGGRASVIVFGICMFGGMAAAGRWRSSDGAVASAAACDAF